MGGYSLVLHTSTHVFLRNTQSLYKSSLTRGLVSLIGLLVITCMDCSLAMISCGQIVPLVVSLAACGGVILPSVVTVVVLIVCSCFGVYKA